MRGVDTLKEQVVRAIERIAPVDGPLLSMRQELAQVLPAELASLDPDQQVPQRRRQLPGIDLREHDTLARLERWSTDYGDLFQALRADPSINVEATGRGYLRNPYFATPDAEFYAGMIADRRPTTIVEVGGGYSTLVARRTIQHLGLDTRLVVVDPEPRTEVAGRADELMRLRIEEVGPERLPLGADSLLFIDSSHVVRSGGDVPLLFGELLPALPLGVLVHVHDIFLPWDYPDVMRLRLYGEQYVLQALLSHSPRYRVVAAVHYVSRLHPDALRAAFGDWLAQDPELYGGSLWFELTGEL